LFDNSPLEELLVQVVLSRPVAALTAVADVQPDPAIAGGLRIRPTSGEVLDPALVVAADGVKSHSAEGRHRP